MLAVLVRLHYSVKKVACCINMPESRILFNMLFTYYIVVLSV